MKQNESSAMWLKVVGLIILVVAVTLATIKFSSPASTVSQKSVYDKVVSSGTIRACYAVYPPALIKDPNTGKLSGVFYDALNKAAENMGLKVEWNTEVGWGEMIEALNSSRCDIIGSPAWSNSTRGKSAEFAVPLYYSAINAYVRANDTRFDSNIMIANDAKYTLSTLDGETSQLIASHLFPKAHTLQLAQTADAPQMVLNVADGKADMAFLEPSVANIYIKNNPGKVKNISVAKPVVVYGNVMMIKKGEFEFKTSMDNAFNELLGNGTIDGLINQYEQAYPGGFYRVAVPYVVPSFK